MFTDFYQALAVRRCVLLFSVLIAGASLARAQDERAKIELLDPAPELQDAVSTAMQGCEPSKAVPHAAINKNNVYVLEAACSKSGHHYAIIDHDPLLIADWQSGQWKLKKALNLRPVWKYPGWDMSTAQTRQPEVTRPFWLVVLAHQPLLVVASDVEKEGQNYNVIIFDAGLEHILDTTASFGTPPMVEAGYLLTSDASRVKAEWEEDDFSRIENNKFVVARSWLSDMPYRQPEPEEFDGDVEYYEASSGGNAYTITPDYKDRNHPEDYLVFKGNLQLDGWRGIVDAWKTSVVFARVSFIPMGAPAADPELAEDELAYLFEKLTGLPRKLYRLPDPIKLDKNVESMETVKVTGSAEAIKLLSPKARKMK